jgi:ribokinase
MSDPTVICAGHVNWDVTLSVDRLPNPDGEAKILDQHQSGGGSASNTAYGLASLGVQSALLGSTGDDEYGSLVRRHLDAVGVDCTHLQTASGAFTTVKYIVVDESGQVAVLANDGANEVFEHEALPEQTLQEAAHLHLTGQSPSTALHLAERAADAGVTLSFDPGRRLDVREYDAVYRLADLLFFNESEAGVVQAADYVEDSRCITVLKRGNDGAEVITDGKRATHQGFDIEPLDTTGAGDAFAAGFITARLDDASLETALAVGNACGALTAQTTGAQRQLSWDDIEAMVGQSLSLGHSG